MLQGVGGKTLVQGFFLSLSFELLQQKKRPYVSLT